MHTKFNINLHNENKINKKEIVDKTYEDSMEELNNLIGELDLFQRQIDASQIENFNNSNSNNNSLMMPTIINNNTNHQQQHPNTNSNDDQNNNSCVCADYVIEGRENLNVGSNSTGDGYENPTFAHINCTATAATTTTTLANENNGQQNKNEEVVLLQDYGSYRSTNSDSSSGVIVIYDHQIPMTPDIDYVKQNSEIVVLRTKDPQQQQQQHNSHHSLTASSSSLSSPLSLLPHEMRELQQLTVNANELITPKNPITKIDNGNNDNNQMSHVNLATVSKQRLSSFRATSDKQLKIKQNQQQQQQQRKHEKGMPKNSSSSTSNNNNSKDKNKEEFRNNNAHKIKTINNGNSEILLLRPKAPIKPPALSIYKGNINIEKKEKLQQQQQHQQPKQPQNKQHDDEKIYTIAKIDCNHKEKLLKHEPQPQEQQQEPSIIIASSSLSTKTTSTSTTTPTTESLPVNSRTKYNNSNAHENITHTPTIHQNDHVNQYNQNHYQYNSNHSKNSLNSSPSYVNLNLINKCVPVSTPVVPTSTSTPTPTTTTTKATGTRLTTGVVSKPCIPTRPASLTGDGGGGGNTRIARRASVNTAKPPPPVRRSSSVTPSHHEQRTTVCKFI